MKKLTDPSKWENMDGNTNLIKKLNSYLTCAFISKSDIPSDECLLEASDINGHREWVSFEIADYLANRFSHKSQGQYEEKCAEEIIKIIQKE